MTWRFALLALLGLLFAQQQARATDLGLQPYRIAYQDRLVTDVYLNGKGPFTFLIDTASSRSIIYEHVRAQLGIGPSSPEPITVFSINTSSPAMAIRPDSLRVAGQSLSDLTMGVLPDIQQGKDPDGVLGIDVLSRYFVVLDRARMELRLLPPQSAASWDHDGWASLALTPKPLKNIPVQFWYIAPVFKDQVLNTLFDLGCGVNLINWGASSKLGYERRDFVKYGKPPEQLRDVLGKTAPVVIMAGLKVRMDSRVWAQQVALVADAPVFDFFDMTEKAGAIIGPGLLKDNSLAIDFAGQKLFIGPTIPQ